MVVCDTLGDTEEGGEVFQDVVFWSDAEGVYIERVAPSGNSQANRLICRVYVRDGRLWVEVLPDDDAGKVTTPVIVDVGDTEN